MDRVAILNGETLDEELLAESFGRTGISNYVERGLCKTLDTDDVDFANAVVDIPAGKAFILDNGRDTMLLADARAGVELGTDGDQHIYICYDLNQPEGERIEFVVSASQTEPALPSLRIAVIDMVSESVDPVNDFAPINDEDAEYYKGNDIDTDGDGVVNEADTANHVAAGDVDGVVPEADHAANADRASDADSLGANVTTGVFGAPIDALGNPLTGLEKIGIEDGAQGWEIRASTVTAGSVIVPRLDGALVSEGSIRYDGDGYEVRDRMAVKDTIESGADDGAGWVWRSNGGNPELVPKNGSVVRSNYGLTYDHPGNYGLQGSLYARYGLSTNGPLKVGTGSGAEGYVIKEGAGTDSALIVPIINGVEQESSAIRYYNSEYTLHDDTTIEGKITAQGVLSTGGTGSGADGFIVGPEDGTDAAHITPKINGSAISGDRLRYRGGRWRLEGDLELNGDTFGLPSVTSDPSDASPGDMWYRDDLD